MEHRCYNSDINQQGSKSDMATEFGNFFREKRKQEKLSLRAISRLTDIPVSYLSKLGNDDNTNPSFVAVFKLSQIFGLSINEVTKFFDISGNLDNEPQKVADIIKANAEYKGTVLSTNEASIYSTIIQTIDKISNDDNIDMTDLITLLQKIQQMADTKTRSDHKHSHYYLIAENKAFEFPVYDINLMRAFFIITGCDYRKSIMLEGKIQANDGYELITLRDLYTMAKNTIIRPEDKEKYKEIRDYLKLNFSAYL
jgi:transcriptional regulator with XRE-family HTH domain